MKILRARELFNKLIHIPPDERDPAEYEEYRKLIEDLLIKEPCEKDNGRHSSPC